MCAKMAFKEMLREKEAKSEKLGLIPKIAKADYTMHSLKHLAGNVREIEHESRHYGNAHSAWEHVALREKWEGLPMNASHQSYSHNHVLRLFENFRGAVL